jgi:hypothetical protein
MTIFIRCGCEALYEQIEIKTAQLVEDSADCRVCGYRLKTWRGNKVLLFELVEDPTG